MSLSGLTPERRKDLEYAALAAQKNYNALYLMSAEDLPLDTIGDVVGSVSAKEWIEIFEKSRKAR